jgi:hypothetical protein
MKPAERPEPDAARLASLAGANYGDVVVEVHAPAFANLRAPNADSVRGEIRIGTAGTGCRSFSSALSPPGA